MKKRKPHKASTLKTLQKEIGSLCPICQCEDVESFQVHHIDENPENNALSNLLMICPTCHDKVTKAFINNEDVIKIKRKVSGELKPKLPKDIENFLKDGKDLRNESKFNEAEKIYYKAFEKANELKDDYSINKCKLALASILNDKKESPDKAIKYIIESERYFRENSLDDNLADVLCEYSIAETKLEKFDSARIHLRESIQLNQKCNDIIGEIDCYHQFGFLEHGNGNLEKSKEYYRKGIELCEKEFHKHDKKVIAGLLGALYSHIALVNKAETNIIEVEKNLEKGLDYFRQSEMKISIGQTLFMLAELKCKTQEIEVGQKYLFEALNLFHETNNFMWLAEGFDLLSLIHYNFGSKEKGKEIFKEAIKAIEQTDDVRNKLKYYCKLAELYKIENNFEEAEKIFNQVIGSANQLGEDEEYFKATIDLVRIKHVQKDYKERNKIANAGIEYLKKVLIKTQRESKRAQTFGDIAAIYIECKNFQEAIKYFLLAKDAFIVLQDKRGIIKCLGSLANIYHITRNQQKEIESNKELHELTTGTYNYYAQASAAFNLCVHEIDNHHFDQAQKYFDETEYLNYKYNLDIDEKIYELEHILNKAKDSFTKPEKGIDELIKDLYTLLNYYPEEQKDLLRFWIFYNGSDLFANYRLLDGLKFLVVTDNTENFLKISNKLNYYSELFIQSFSKKFERNNISIFHYPYEYPIPKGVSILFQKKGQEIPEDFTKTKITISKLSRQEFNDCKIAKSSILGRQKCKMGDYTIFFVVDKNMEHTEEATISYHKVLNKNGIKLKPKPGNVILGYPIQFPDKFENLILNSTAQELIDKKIFFNLIDRSNYKDRFLMDIMMSEQFGFIPVYENKLPKSDRIIIIDQTKIEIPLIDLSDFSKFENKLKKIKNSIIKYSMKIKNETIPAQTLKMDIEDYTPEKNKIKLIFDLYVLQYETHNRTERQIAFAYKNNYQIGDIN